MENMTFTQLWYAASLSKEQADLVNQMFNRVGLRVLLLGTIVGLVVGYIAGNIRPWH